MSISAGDKLGPYEVLASIGAGGMGEVYRARDPRLGREVAIKVSAERFSERFEREARAIAALNHPNICTLFDVGPNYLVMELVEGETLTDRIKRAPIPLEEALPIARQIADALDAAHEKGIVHRDLKPGNIKIKPDGAVKVLDFGLAKTGGTPVTSSDNSPTLTMAQTEAGMILGTASYMAPEQAKGKPVDKRADIYAFGAVLYEMLTGKRLHQGETTTEVLASVMKEEPAWENVPPQVKRLLQRCLEKDPQKRLRHIGDVMALVDDAPPVDSQSRAAKTPRTGKLAVWIAAAVALLIGAGLLAWSPWRAQPNLVPVRFEVAESDQMKFFGGGYMSVSPDGHWMVFPAIGDGGVARYWIRSLDTVEARALPGTEGAFVPAAWSPDSRYVIFTTLGSNKLMKVDIQGGPPQALAEVPYQLNGATGNNEGTIVIGVAAPAGSQAGPTLFRLSESGGTLAPVTALAKGEFRHAWPQFLPDGHHFLYLRVSSDPNQMGAYVGSIDDKPGQQSTHRLLATNRQAYYSTSPGSRTGYLIFLRDTTLMAQPFDPDKLELSGEPAPIAEGVDSFPLAQGGLFSVSNTGALVYRAGAGSKPVLTWFDPSGNPAGSLGETGDYSNPAISPDGRRVAVSLGSPGSRDIWIVDVAKGTTTRFTFDPANDDYALWSSDGKNIVFSSNRTGQNKLYIKPSDGSGEERLLTDQPGVATSWSKDSRFLLFTVASPKTGSDIWVAAGPGLSPGPGGAVAKPFLATQASEAQSQFSPDGRWVAYMSGESGTPEVYVRPFPAGESGVQWLVSKGGAAFPRWRPDGKALYFKSLGNEIMTVDVDTSKEFQAGTPKRLFAATGGLTDAWDIAPDGKRFLFIAPANAGRPAPFTVVLNWAAGPKK